jgi:hypothetical protein
LLAAIMQRCFQDFADSLDKGAKQHDCDALRGMGEAYMRYASQKPLEYRLMFGTPWPEPASHPELVRHAVHAFGLLRHHLHQQLRSAHNDPGDAPALLAQAELQALFIWSSLHGMASIQQANVMQHLVLSPSVPALAEPYLMGMIHTALAHGPAQAPAPQAPPPGRP